MVFPGMVFDFCKLVVNDNVRFHNGVRLGGQEAIRLRSQRQ